MKIGHIHRMSMNPCGLRFDSSYHLSDGVTVKRNIAASPYPFMLIGKAAERIFIGGRARRVYVKDRKHGIPFLSSSDILQADVTTQVGLSYSPMHNFPRCNQRE